MLVNIDLIVNNGMGRAVDVCNGSHMYDGCISLDDLSAPWGEYVD